MMKARVGSVKPDHKYISRTGSAGNYDYKYAEDANQVKESAPDMFGFVRTAKTLITNEEIQIANITPDPEQPRKDFEQSSIVELGQSIKKIGLIQDIAVRPDPAKDGHYIIIAGERRWRAMTSAGIETTRAKVYHITDPKDIAPIQVAENVGRKEMNPMEEATAYRKLFDAGYEIDEIAKKIGASPVTVERRMALLELIPMLQHLVKTGSIPINHGVIIAQARLRPEFQQNVLKKLNAGNLSTEALSGIVGQYKSAQTQTSFFDLPAGKSAIDMKATKQRQQSLKRDMTKLLEEFGGLMERLQAKDGAKLLPAMAKQNGQLRIMAQKVSMITEEMKKIDRQMKYAVHYFEGGGSIGGYLESVNVKKQKGIKKRIRKAISNFMKPDHKYIKREGSAGRYKYTYAADEVQSSTPILIDRVEVPMPKSPWFRGWTADGSYVVKYDYRYGNVEWAAIKDKIKAAGAQWDKNSQNWYIKRENLGNLVERFDKVAVTKRAQGSAAESASEVVGKPAPEPAPKEKKKTKRELEIERHRKQSEEWALLDRLESEAEAKFDKLGIEEVTSTQFEGMTKVERDVWVKREATKIEDAGSRGSVNWWVDEKGRVRYGKRPQGAKFIPLSELDKYVGWLESNKRDIITGGLLLGSNKVSEDEKKKLQRDYNYAIRSIESGAKKYLTDQEAESGSGALKPSTFTSPDPSETDALAIFAALKEANVFRISSRGEFKGKIILDRGNAQKYYDTIRGQGSLRSAMRILLEHMNAPKGWSVHPMAPPQPNDRFGKDKMAALLTGMITKENEQTDGGHAGIRSIISGTKIVAGKKDIYAHAKEVASSAQDMGAFESKAREAFKSEKSQRIAGMRKEFDLFNYQKRYVNWMNSVERGVNAADTALGKTLTSLAFIKNKQDSKEIKGGLCFLPISVMSEWESEYEKFFSKKPKILYLINGEKQNLADIAKISDKNSYDLIVASHGLVGGGGKQMAALMKKTSKYAVFFDEAHKGLLNPQNKIYKNYEEHVKQKFQFLLTATPDRNEPMDLFHLNNLLHRGALGTATAWKSNYYTSVETGMGKKTVPNLEMMKPMWARITPYMPPLSKYSAGVDLPARFDKTVNLTMGDKQKTYYKAAQRALLEGLLEIENPAAMKGTESNHIFALITKMRFAAFDPRMVNPKYGAKDGETSVMWDGAKDLIEAHISKPYNKGVIVGSSLVKPFEAYIKDLETLGLKRSEIGLITGSISKKERDRVKDAFNRKEIKILFMGVKSGGVGLNLQKGGDMLITMSDPWTYADKKQLVDRIIRQGQDAKTVEIYDFNVKDTITDFVRGKIAMKQAMHKESDPEGAYKEAIKTLTFNDFLRMAGSSEAEYASAKKARGTKAATPKKMPIKAKIKAGKK
jgi:ParB/RepB/Spo0J family partition protein